MTTARKKAPPMTRPAAAADIIAASSLMTSSPLRLLFDVNVIIISVIFLSAITTTTTSTAHLQQQQQQQKRSHHVSERAAGMTSSSASEPRCRFPEFLQTKKGKPWMMKMHHTFSTIDVDGGKMFVRYGTCSRRRSADSYRHYASARRYSSSSPSSSSSSSPRRRHSRLTADCTRSRYTRLCQEIRPGNRYLVSHHESDYPTKYTCLEFLQRGVSVVQVKLSFVQDNKSIPFLCQDRSMSVDPWPWISDEHYRSPSVRCPITGGFDLQLRLSYPRPSGRYKYHGVHPEDCMDGSTPPIRIESNCVDGEGVKFNFKHKSCLPAGAHLSLNQTALCMASWRDGRELFAMLRAGNNDRAFFCLRVTLPESAAESSQLGRSVMGVVGAEGKTTIEEMTLFIGWVCPRGSEAEATRYPGSHIYKTIGVRSPYMVFTVHDQLVVDNPCSDQLTTCSNHAPFCSHLQCMKTCHKCLAAQTSSSTSATSLSAAASSSSSSTTPATGDAPPTAGISLSPDGEEDDGPYGSSSVASSPDSLYSFSPRMGAMMTKKAIVENHDRFSVRYAKSEDRPDGDFDSDSHRRGSILTDEEEGGDGPGDGGGIGGNGESMNGGGDGGAGDETHPHQKHRHPHSNRHYSGEGAADKTGTGNATGSGDQQRHRASSNRPQSTQRKCTFPVKVQGTWLQRGTDGEDMTFTVTETTFTHPQVGTMECVTFSPTGEPTPLRRVLWSRYDNGCYPRFTCVHFNTPAKSVIRYRLANVQQWPLELSDDSICGEKNFKDSPDMYQPGDKYSMRPWQVVRRAGHVHRMACILPTNIPKVVSFRDDKGRSGCLVHGTYYSPRAVSLTFFPLPPDAKPDAAQPQSLPPPQQQQHGEGEGSSGEGEARGGERRGSATLPLRTRTGTSSDRRIDGGDGGSGGGGGGGYDVSGDSSSASSYVMNKHDVINRRVGSAAKVRDADRGRTRAGGGGREEKDAGGYGRHGSRGRAAAPRGSYRSSASRSGSRDRNNQRRQPVRTANDNNNNDYYHRDSASAGAHAATNAGVAGNRGFYHRPGSRSAHESSQATHRAQNRNQDWSYQYGHGRSNPETELNPYQMRPTPRNHTNGKYVNSGGAAAGRAAGYSDGARSGSSRDGYASNSRRVSSSSSYASAPTNVYGRYTGSATTTTTNDDNYSNQNSGRYANSYNRDSSKGGYRWSGGKYSNNTGTYHYYHPARRTREARGRQSRRDNNFDFDFEFIDHFYKFGDFVAEKSDKYRRSNRRGSKTSDSSSTTTTTTTSSSSSSRSRGSSISDVKSRLQVSYECLAVVTYSDTYLSLLTMTANDPREILCWLMVDDLTVVILKTSSCNSQTAQRVLSGSPAAGPDRFYADHVASILHLQQGRRDCNVMFPSDSARPEPIEFRDEDAEQSGAAAWSGNLSVWSLTALVVLCLIR